MIYMLFDNPGDKKNMEFLNSSSYGTSSIKQEYPKTKCNSIKEMINACLECVEKSSDGDTIVCWFDFMGILCWWICQFKRQKRQIVVLNILLKEKNTLKNKIARFLYKIALKSKNVQATVTSQEYGKWINNLLNINKEYTLLHDIYHGGYTLENSENINPKSVFCGGRNGRNWEFLFDLAANMPDVEFNCVMSKEKYQQYKDKFRENINAKYDIPEKDFLNLMCESSLIVMPLETEAPAGLIALFQAAANERPILTSDTVTTREYFNNDRGILCKDSIEDWKVKITYYLEHRNEAEEKIRCFKEYLETECSEQKYAETLRKILNI